MAIGRTHEELLRTISTEELTLWYAFDEMDPISLHHRVDLAGGVIASSNINRHVTEVSKLKSPIDFMPVLQREERQNKASTSNAADLRAMFRGIIKKQQGKKP